MKYQHDINVNMRRQPNIGGTIILILVGWWIFRGYLPSVFNAAYQHGIEDIDGLMASPVCGDGYGSVSYVLFTMAWQAFGGLLAWAAIAWGFIQWAIRDVLECVARIASDVADSWKAEKEVEQAVVTEHVTAVTQTTPRKKTFEEMTTDERVVAIAHDQVNKSKSFDKRLTEIDQKIESSFKELSELIKAPPKPKATPRRRTTKTKTTEASE